MPRARREYIARHDVPRRVSRDLVDQLGISVAPDNAFLIDGSRAMEETGEVQSLVPTADNTYVLGADDLVFGNVFAHSITLDDAGQIYDNGSANQPRIVARTGVPASNSYYSYINLDARSYNGNYDTNMELIAGRSGAVVGSVRFDVSGVTDLVSFAEYACDFKTSLWVHGGVGVFPPLVYTLPPEASYVGYYRSEPNVPSAAGASGFWSLWVSNGSGTGDSGDLMLRVRSGGVTKRLKVADFSAGYGDNTIEEYLYHAGDTDTYLRFTDDRIRLATGGTVQVDLANDKMGVNESSPTGKVHINQDSTTAAIPVLHLEQDDESEEFIRYTGKAGAGGMGRSIVSETDVAVATRLVWVKAYVVDEGNQVTDREYYVPLYVLAQVARGVVASESTTVTEGTPSLDLSAAGFSVSQSATVTEGVPSLDLSMADFSVSDSATLAESQVVTVV